MYIQQAERTINHVNWTNNILINAQKELAHVHVTFNDWYSSCRLSLQHPQFIYLQIQ